MAGVLSLAAAFVVMSSGPAPAAECHREYLVGGTVTVAGQSVRHPTIDIVICFNGADASLVPTLDVITTPTGSCTANCYAVVVRQDPNSNGTQLVLRVQADGSPEEQWYWIPHDHTDHCIFGVGFPDPPVSGCLVSYDPDW